MKSWFVSSGQDKPGSWNWVLFPGNTVSFNMVSVSPRRLNVLLFSLGCGCALPPIGWIRSAHHHTPTRWRWDFPSVYVATSFVQKGCKLPASCARLCCFPQSRYGWLTWTSWNFSQWLQESAALVTCPAGRAVNSERFCVHKSWWVQNHPSTFKICAVLSIEFLLFGERMTSEAAACWFVVLCLPGVLCAWKANLKFSHCTLYAPCVLAASDLVKKPHYLTLAIKNLKFSFRFVSDWRSRDCRLPAILVPL
jgi:hypothetical protein